MNYYKNWRFWLFEAYGYEKYALLLSAYVNKHSNNEYLEMIPDAAWLCLANIGCGLLGWRWLNNVGPPLGQCTLDTSYLIFSWETACLSQMSYWKFKLTQVCFNLCDKETDNKLNMFMLRKTFQFYPFLWFCIFHGVLWIRKTGGIFFLLI